MNILQVLVCVYVPVDVVVLRYVQGLLQLSAESETVCVFGRVRVVKK